MDAEVGAESQTHEPVLLQETLDFHFAFAKALGFSRAFDEHCGTCCGGGDHEQGIGDRDFAGELVAGGAKLIGSAQWRENGALLQHGSILVDDDQSSLSDLSSSLRATNGSIPQPATLHALLGRAPDPQEVANATFDAVRSLEDAEATEMAEDDVRGDALKLVPHFLNEDWTWRR